MVCLVGVVMVENPLYFLDNILETVNKQAFVVNDGHVGTEALF